MDRAVLIREVYDRLLAHLGPQGWWPGDGPFETIAGAILTQNAAWANAEKALANLRAAEAMSWPAIRALPEEELALLVRPSGYFNAKARKLKAFADYMAGRGDTLDGTSGAKELRAELLAVHGIGPETADDIVLYAAGLASFVIDTYTQRIVDRLGIAPERRSYDAYQALFEDALPADAPGYNEYHALLDAHAKAVCTKREPRCGACVLLDLCPTGAARSPGPGTRSP
ncbi:MAG: endonuclease [Chloroflexi bacterium]|nr:endonuclease [Chloroflexota bacterium]